MSAARRILLVSPDLMVGSRLAGMASARGTTVDTIMSLDAPLRSTGYAVAILDLQGLRGDAGDLVTRARERLATHGPAEGAGPAIVAFGPHVAADLLAAARTAGADDVISRGELLGSFAAVLDRNGG